MRGLCAGEMEGQRQGDQARCGDSGDGGRVGIAEGDGVQCIVMETCAQIEAGLAEAPGKTEYDAKNRVLLPRAVYAATASASNFYDAPAVPNHHIFNQFIKIHLLLGHFLSPHPGKGKQIVDQHAHALCCLRDIRHIMPALGVQ